MAKYIVKRILYMLLVVLILSFLIYLIFDLVPFDRAKWLVEKQKDVYKDNPEGYQRAYLEDGSGSMRTFSCAISAGWGLRG